MAHARDTPAAPSPGRQWYCVTGTTGCLLHKATAVRTKRHREPIQYIEINTENQTK